MRKEDLKLFKTQQKENIRNLFRNNVSFVHQLLKRPVTNMKAKAKRIVFLRKTYK